MNYTRKLKLMLYNTLKRWVLIVVCAIIAAAVLGAVATVKEIGRIKNYETNPAELQELVEKSENKVNYYKNELEKLDREIEEAKKLIKDTDTVQVSEALININVIADEGIAAQKLEEIKYIYYAVVNNVSLYEKITEELGLNIAPFTLKRLVGQTQNSSAIIISVKGFEQAINEKIRDKVVEEIFATEKNLNVDIETHKINLISETSTEIKESVYTDVFNELDSERESLIASLHSSEKLVMDYQNDNHAKHINASNVLLYIVMGIILGIAAGIVLSAIITIFDNKIYSSDDIILNFDLKLLGEAKIGTPKKLNVIDRLINRLFGYNQAVFSIANSDPLKAVEAEKLLFIVENKENKEKIRQNLHFKPFIVVDKFSNDSKKELVLKAANEVTEADMQMVSDIALDVVYNKSCFKQFAQKLSAIEALNKNVIGFIGLSVQDGE